MPRLPVCQNPIYHCIAFTCLCFANNPAVSTLDNVESPPLATALQVYLCVSDCIRSCSSMPVFAIACLYLPRFYINWPLRYNSGGFETLELPDPVVWRVAIYKCFQQLPLLSVIVSLTSVVPATSCNNLQYNSCETCGTSAVAIVVPEATCHNLQLLWSGESPTQLFLSKPPSQFSFGNRKQNL